MSGIVWSDGETIENAFINAHKKGTNAPVVTECLLPSVEKFNYVFCTLHSDTTV